MTVQMQSALGAYRAAATQVHPLVAVVRLYDEVVRRIGKLIEATEAGRPEEAYIHLTRASQILRGLAANLRNPQQGPDGEDMVSTLKQTYIAQLLALHGAFGKKDSRQRYLRIRKGILELRNAWAETAGMAPAQLPTEKGRS